MWKTLGLAAVLGACNGDPKPDTTDAADTDSDPVDGDDDGFPVGADCDDGDPTVHPGAPDSCGDDRVTDCDRTSDDGLVTVDGLTTFTDLASALGGATDGARILVCPGTWTGTFTASAPVELVSHGGSDTTILDGGALGTTLSVPAGSTVTGLTLTNGRSTGSGGGLLLTSAGPLTVVDSVIRDNDAGSGGGLSVPGGSDVVLSGTTISGNEAQTVGGGLFAEGSTIDLTTSVVSDNTAGQGGGGVALTNGALVGGEISGNHSPGSGPYVDLLGGGGLATSGVCTVTGTDIAFNDGEWGGGVSASGGSLTLIDVEVHENSVPYYASGGGVATVAADVVLEGTSVIRENTSGYRGAGVMMVGGTWFGGALTGNVSQDAGGGFAVAEGEVTAVTISGNVANQGGGVYVFGSATLTDLAVDGNEAADGGGVMMTGGYVIDEVVTLRISGGTYTSNAAESGGGFLGTGAEAVIEGALLADNAATYGGGIFLKGASATVDGATVIRNTGSYQGGGAMLVDASLGSEGADWGTGVDDNLPSDVHAGELVYTGYDDAETFGCTIAGCTPEP